MHVLSALLLMSCIACDGDSFFSFSSQASDKLEIEKELSPKPEVSAQFIAKAAAALPAAWPKGAQLIQLKVLPELLEIQGGFTPKRDQEGERTPSAFVLTFRCSNEKNCQFSPPKEAKLSETGRYEDNLFSLSLLHLEAIARSIGTARQSVDPQRGRVTEIRARRFLPFSKAVRVRYYISSPLLPGTMDANGRGIPLKR